MNRRDVIKSVGSVPIVPSVSIPDVSESVNYTYLDSLFDSEYRTVKNANGVLGKTYTANYREAKEKYEIQYRAYSEDRNVVVLYDNTESGCVYKQYTYYPQIPYEAWTLTEIGRKQGLEAMKSALSKLELKYEGKVKV